jgi:pyruvate/2-oxoglutarate dehydrogenase complex dihydrolipoamide acyltransferase (E2) component
VSTGEKIVDVQEGDKVSTGKKIVDVQEGDKVSTGEKIVDVQEGDKVSTGELSVLNIKLNDIFTCTHLIILEYQ